MRLFLKTMVFLATACAVAALSAPSAMAQSQKKAGPKQPQSVARFDGSWSVLVVTEAGNCDRAYRYGVTIRQGVVNYGGEAGITLSGGVDASGRVSVSLRRGQDGAQGTGQLTEDAGEGTWSGRAGSLQCSGYWEAERRGQ